VAIPTWAKAGGAIVALILIARCAPQPLPRTETPPAPPAPVLDDAACRQDIACWSKRHSARARSPCTRAIEAQLRFAHEWTDGLTSPRFPRVGWKDPATGSFTLFGDALRVQNAFGAMQRADYACVYHPESGTVEQALVELK
jgi:hypothetical protein